MNIIIDVLLTKIKNISLNYSFNFNKFDNNTFEVLNRVIMNNDEINLMRRFFTKSKGIIIFFVINFSFLLFHQLSFPPTNNVTTLNTSSDLVYSEQFDDMSSSWTLEGVSDPYLYAYLSEFTDYII